MTKKIDIGGELHSVATDHKVADSSEIKDISKGNKSQTAFNNDIDRHEVEIHGTGGIDSRLTDVEQIEQIALDGGEAQIAQGSDFTNPDATKRAKIPTVGAIVDGLNDGVYDVSKRNPTAGPNSDGKFTLDYILNNANTLIPIGWRHGGMTISFVQSSDNKYIQARLMANAFTTDVTQWQVVDDEPTAGSNNLVKSGGVAKEVSQKSIFEGICLLGKGEKYYNKNISKNDSTRTPSSANGWISLVVDIFNGFKFYIKGTGGTSPVLWFATNSQNTIFANSGEAATFDGEVTLSNTDASKLYVNLNLTANPDSRFEILSDVSRFASGELLEKTDISNSVSFEGNKLPNETGVANLHTTSIFSTINLMGMGVKYLNKQIKVNTPSYVPNDANGWICASVNVYQGFRFYINGKGATFPELWFSTDDNGTILQRSGQGTAYNGIITLYHPNTKKLYVNLNTATVQESQLELLPNSDYPQLVKSQNLKQSLQNYVSTKQDDDLISHDATIQYYNKKLYVISMANQHDTGDSGEFSDYSFLRLDIYNANDGVGSKINSIVVAKPNDAVGDTTILGGCGVPNAKITGSTLHILVGCKLASDGKWRILHYAYDCANDTLSTPTICKMDGVDMTGTILATHSSIATDFNYQMSINASFARVYIGNYTFYYACLASAQRIPNGLIIRTVDFINWEFVKEPTEMNAHSSYEIAMGSYNGNIYLAYRQLPTYGTCVIGMYKTDGTFVDKITIPADDSRPQFFDMPDGLYLLVAKDSRKHARIYKLDNNSLILKDIAIAWTGERYCGNYLEFLPIGEYQYYCQSNLIDNVLQVCIGGTRAFSLTFDDVIINSLQ